MITVAFGFTCKECGKTAELHFEAEEPSEIAYDRITGDMYPLPDGWLYYQDNGEASGLYCSDKCRKAICEKIEPGSTRDEIWRA